jgi:hypothetical protein
LIRTSVPSIAIQKILGPDPISFCASNPRCQLRIVTFDDDRAFASPYRWSRRILRDPLGGAVPFSCPVATSSQLGGGHRNHRHRRRRVAAELRGRAADLIAPIAKLDGVDIRQVPARHPFQPLGRDREPVSAADVPMLSPSARSTEDRRVMDTPIAATRRAGKAFREREACYSSRDI